jgi:hypothetical protein
MFSVFVAMTFCVNVLASNLPGISDAASAIVVALFIPFIGLRYYLLFLGFHVASILADYPRIYMITYSGALIASHVDNGGLPFSEVIPISVWGHLVIVIAFLIFYVVQPYLIYRGLRKFGFYGLVSGALG